MKKLCLGLTILTAIIPYLFANTNTLGLGEGYGGYFFDDLSLQGAQVSFSGQNLIANNVVLHAETSLIFPSSFTMNTITLDSDLFDLLLGMDFLFAVGYNIPKLGNVLGVMIGAGFNYKGLYYNLDSYIGRDHLLGVGALANLKLNFNKTIGLIFSLRYAYSFVDFSSVWTPSIGEVNKTEYVNGSSIEGKMYLAISWE